MMPPNVSMNPGAGGAGMYDMNMQDQYGNGGGGNGQYPPRMGNHYGPNGPSPSSSSYDNR